MKADALDSILASRARRAAVVRLTWLDDGRDRLVEAPDEIADDPELREAVSRALRDDRSGCVEARTGRVFVHPFNPPLRLAIVGAVHIAQRLASLARDLGYAVTVIDPRTGFLTEARFPRVELDASWPDEALRRFEPDRRSAVVTLSHDPKIDEPALAVALRAPCFYVGALGSRRTQEKRRERLRASGLSEAELARIHGPVGLDIGARSPGEIALSIAAEMTARLRAG